MTNTKSKINILDAFGMSDDSEVEDEKKLSKSEKSPINDIIEPKVEDLEMAPAQADFSKITYSDK